MSTSVPIGSLCTTLKNTLNPQINKKGMFKHYSIPSFDNGSPVLEYGSEIHSNKIVIDRPCILFSRLNPRIRRVWDLSNLNNNHPAIASMEFVPFVLVDNKRLFARYLFWFLHTEKFLSFARAGVRAATKSRERVKKEHLFEVEIPLPPLAEQKRIAAILDKSDAIRRKRKKAISLTEEFLRSTFLDMMVEWSAKCREVSLKETTTNERNSFVNGPFGSNLLKIELQSEGIPVIYIRDIREGHYKRISKAYISKEKANQLNVCNVKSGDVLVAKVGEPPGTTAIYPNPEPDAIVTQDVIRMRINLHVSTPEFVTGYLNSSLGKHRMKYITVEATRSRFSLGSFKNIVIKLPPLKVQEKFSDLVKRVYLTKSHVSGMSTLESNLFNSLVQHAFRGELTG